MSSILAAIAANAERSPDAIALSDAGHQIRYGELPGRIERVAAQVLAHCPGPAPVVFTLENSAAWALLDLALLQLGRTAVPLPHFFSAQQRSHVVAEVVAGYCLTDQAPTSDASPAFSIAGRRLFRIDCRKGGTADQSEGQPEPRPPGLPPETAKVTYTSGSTGQPKGVCLSLAGLETVAASIVERVGAEHGARHCAILPLAVLLENVAGLYATLLAGGHYHAPAPTDLGLERPFQPDFARLIDGLGACRARSAIMVPELLRGTVAVMRDRNLTLPCLEVLAVGGATVSAALLADAAALGLPVLQGYGLSEMGSVVTLNGLNDNVQGSVGRPLRHISMCYSEEGELVIRDPIFLGYAGNGSSSPLLHTGDLARTDDAGHVYFLGRKSNLLITSFGRNVAPEWVESELLNEPLIAQAFVFGDAAPALGALIVPRSEAVSTHEVARAIERANARLPAYAAVRHWSLVEPFTPVNAQLTTNGRSRRSAIAQAHAERMQRCLQRPGEYSSFFDRLRRETTPERMVMQQVPQIQDALRGQVSLQSYLDYLTEAYHHVRHTVPLMRLTSARLSSSHQWLREALDDYIQEETGHEQWILDDIRHAGGDAERARNGPARPATARMVAYAYDYIEHVNPVGFFGMIYVLEGTSIQLALRAANSLMASLQLPAECFRYLLSHGGLDVGHMSFFSKLMDRVVDSADQDAIIEVARAMFRLFGDMFASIPHLRGVANGA